MADSITMTGQFPWLCLKCGQMFGNITTLVDHMEAQSHQLSLSELNDWDAAFRNVVVTLQERAFDREQNDSGKSSRETGA